MREFRPRLTVQMLEVLLEAIDQVATELANEYDEKKQKAWALGHKLVEKEGLHFDKNPDYQRLHRESEKARDKVELLEDIEIQFQRLLNNRVKGRRERLKPWRSRIYHKALRNEAAR